MGARRSFKTFDPRQNSAVTGWLRLRGSTITGSGYASVPDVMLDNPAVQATDGSRPPNLAAANGQPRADFDGSADHLSWPAATNNNHTVTSGVALWVETDATTAVYRGFYCARPGATNRIDIARNGADLLIDVYASQFASRRATVSTAFVAGTKYFITWEYNGAGATDADKCIITINGVVQTCSFSDGNGAPGSMPATLVATAGPFIIGSLTAATGFFDGKIGPHVFTLGSKMALATEGLLTAKARSQLASLDQPT